MWIIVCLTCQFKDVSGTGPSTPAHHTVVCTVQFLFWPMQISRRGDIEAQRLHQLPSLNDSPDRRGSLIGGGFRSSIVPGSRQVVAKSKLSYRQHWEGKIAL